MRGILYESYKSTRPGLYFARELLAHGLSALCFAVAIIYIIDVRYAAFGNIPESRILSPEEIGLTDDAVIQLRLAVYGVGTGTMTIDEAVAGFGTYGQ